MSREYGAFQMPKKSSHELPKTSTGKIQKFVLRERARHVMTDKPLAGKVALITGASAGLGKHFAAFLAAQGAQTVLAARRLEELEETAAPIAQPAGLRIA